MKLHKPTAIICGIAIAASLLTGTTPATAMPTPGTTLQAKTVKKKPVPKITITVPKSVKAGTKATITGKVTLKGKPIKKTKVTIYQAGPTGPWKKTTTVKTTTKGKYTAKIKISKPTRFKITVPGTTTRAAKTATTGTVNVKAKTKPYISQGPKCWKAAGVWHMKFTIKDPDYAGYAPKYELGSINGHVLGSGSTTQGTQTFEIQAPDATGSACKVWLTKTKPYIASGKVYGTGTYAFASKSPICDPAGGDIEFWVVDPDNLGYIVHYTVGSDGPNTWGRDEANTERFYGTQPFGAYIAGEDSATPCKAWLT